VGISFISWQWPHPLKTSCSNTRSLTLTLPLPLTPGEMEGARHFNQFHTTADDWARWPWRLTMKNDLLRRLTTTAKKNNWPQRTTDHNDWPQYDSAPFWFTRTRPCATFDIRGHVWVESFHCLAHCEQTMRCVHCKTTCVYITFWLTKTCICVTINISHYVFYLPSHQYTWILIPPRDFLTYKSFSISLY